MSYFKLLTATLLLSSLASAAAITSTQTGNWNSGSTWVGGVVPGNNDTAILANGHTVTIPVGVTVTVGTSPSNDTSTPAIACSSSSGSGALVINGTLKYRGSVRQCAGWSASSTAHIQHDSSLGAGTPSYTWQWPSGCGTTCSLSVVGTSSSRIAWDTATGSGVTGYIGAALASGDNGQLVASYVDWTNLGSSSQYSFQATLHSSGAQFVIQNSTCTNCGQIALWERANGTTFSLSNFKLMSAVATSANAVNMVLTNAFTSGTLEIKNSYIGPGQLNLNCASFINPGLVLRGNFFYNEFANVNYGATPCNLPESQWDNNVLWTNNATSSGGSILPAGNLKNTFLLSSVQDTCVNENYHTTTFATENTTLDGWIIESDCGKERPNSFGGKPTEIGSTPGSHAYTIRVTNSIQLPRSAGLGGSAGNGTLGVADSLVWNVPTCNGSSTFCGVVTVDHNTTYTSDVGVLYTTESPETQSTTIAAAKDNIIWRSTSGASGKIGLTGHTLANGSILGAGYNWKYNDSGAGLQYDGSSSYYSPASGTGDTSGNPQFADSSRNFVKWGQTIDPSITTWAGLRDKFKSVDAVTSGYTPEALMAWVRAGFTPANAATATASSTGGRVGAVPVSGTAVPAIFYSDLTSGPKTGGESNQGVFVTINGKNFGASQGTSTITLGGGAVTVKSWSDSKIVFQPGPSGATGDIAVTASEAASNGVPFTVRAGNIYCVSNSGSNANSGVFTGSASNCWATLYYAGAHIVAGDTLILGKSSSDNYQSENNTLSYVSDTSFSLRSDAGIVTGTTTNPIAMMGYPGATAIVGGPGPTYGAQGIWGSFAHTIGWWTFANLRVIAGTSYNGVDQGYGTGAMLFEGFPGLRVINCDIQNPVAYIGGGINVVKTLATPTGGKTTWLYGNYVHNITTPGPTWDNKRIYMMYIGSDGNEVEAAWNRIDDGDVSSPANRCFHVHSSPFIQGQQVDGFRIYGLSAHDNLIQNCGGNGFDGTVDPAIGTGVEIYNNVWNNVANCPNWHGEQSGYVVINFSEAGAYADFNWTPGGGVARVYNNTINNSGYCSLFPSSSGIFAGTAYYEGSPGYLSPPTKVHICAAGCTQNQSGTLPATDYAPNNYFPKTVSFAVIEGSPSNNQFVIDDGSGNLLQEGQTVGTINYTTGAYSFTLLRATINPDVYYHTTSAYSVELKNNIFNLAANQQWQVNDYSAAGLYRFGGDHNLFASVTYPSGPAWPLHFTSNIGSNSDPTFVSSSDFHLQIGSPAIASGVKVGIPRDFDGYLRTTTDVGAFIYTGAAPPSVSPTTGALASGTVGTVYSQTLTASNFSGTVTWSLISGSLPTGLSGCTSGTGTTCSIAGTPSTTSGSPFSFTIRATDGITNVDRIYSVTISSVSSPSVSPTTGALITGVVGSAYSQTLTASSFTGTVTWSLLSGSLPTGLSGCSGTGLTCSITGTPSTVSGSPFSFTIRASDGSTNVDTAYSITINTSNNGGAKKGGKSTSGGKINH